MLSGLKQGDRIVASLEREGVKAGVLVKPEDKAKSKTSPNAKTSKAK